MMGLGSDVTPLLSQADVSSLILGDAVGMPQFDEVDAAVIESSSHLNHLISCDLSGIALLTASNRFWANVRRCVFSFRLASLGDLIRHIVLLGADKQMARIDACLHVALVQNKESVGDWAVSVNPHQAMRRNPSVVPFRLPISARRDLASPNPASVGIIGLCDLRPEPIVHNINETSARAKLDLGQENTTSHSCKWDTASLTDKRNATRKGMIWGNHRGLRSGGSRPRSLAACGGLSILNYTGMAGEMAVLE